MYAVTFSETYYHLGSVTNMGGGGDFPGGTTASSSYSVGVSFGKLRLLRQQCFKGESLVPPVASCFAAVALPWGCSASTSTAGVAELSRAVSPSSRQSALISPEKLAQRTLEGLLIPFDLYLREEASEGRIAIGGAGAGGGMPCSGEDGEAGRGNETSPMESLFGLWCRSSYFLVSEEGSTAYLCLEVIDVRVMRLLKAFTANVQYSDLLPPAGAEATGAPGTTHRRRFVVFPTFAFDSFVARPLRGVVRPSAALQLPSVPPLSSFYELPACVVCLDRLDVTVSGLLPHLYHHGGIPSPAAGGVVCTSKGGQQCSCVLESSCPICVRCVEYATRRSTGGGGGAGAAAAARRATPSPPTAEVVCYDCGIDDDLYQCMLCGHVGCSRYRLQHARKHYSGAGHPRVEGGAPSSPNASVSHGSWGTSTSSVVTPALPLMPMAHAFSMCLASQEIWDYASDAFAHRLVMRITAGGGGEGGGAAAAVAVRQLVYSASSTEAGGPSRFGGSLARSTFQAPQKQRADGAGGGPSSWGIIDEYLVPRDRNASHGGRPVTKGDMNDNDCDDGNGHHTIPFSSKSDGDDTVYNGANAVLWGGGEFLKYDAKMEHLCTQYTVLLSHQVEESRRAYEGRMAPVIDLHRRAVEAAADGGVGGDIFDVATSGGDDVDACSDALRTAAAAFGESVKALQCLVTRNDSIQSEENAVNAQIAEEKAFMEDTLSRRADELRGKDATIEGLREMIAEMELNLSARAAIARKGGIGGTSAIMGGGSRGTGSAGPARGRGRR